MDSNSPLLNLVVIYGGQSAEHDVSCVTAAHVLKAVDPKKYKTTAIAISRDGHWSLPALPVHADGTTKPEAIPDTLSASGPSTTSAVLSALGANTVVMPLLHGPLGEDGTIQGLLELLNLAYVGSAVLASAVAMDKGVSKSLFAQHNIPQARHITLREDAITPSVLQDAASRLGLPLFVKPANMGSSVGVTKAHTIEEFQAAVAHAATYDEWIICEECITGREIEVAVIGNRSPRTSVAGEIIPGNEFYDYEDKYVTDSATLMIPALLSEQESTAVRELALRAYNALHCEGMARVDFFYEENGRGFLCNEINTIPGFTPISMYPKLWNATGVPYSQLIDELIELAIERHARRKRTTSR